jgi:hypothetical protein
VATISFQQSALFEHRFWLQILGDHSRFIFNALAPTEQEYITQAKMFMEIFDELLCAAREVSSGPQLMEITKEACENAERLRSFKLCLLRRHLADEIKVNMTPTFFSHMVNELEEYLKVLGYLLARKPAPYMHPLHHHLLWVSDAQGHAATLASRFDLVETDIIATGQCFAEDFKNLYVKALELKGYTRTGLDEFPALTRYNFQVAKEIKHFDAFLCKVFELVSTKKGLSQLPPLTPDHMLREECYFLTKLAEVSDVKCPACDPTRPRVE